MLFIATLTASVLAGVGEISVQSHKFSKSSISLNPLDSLVFTTDSLAMIHEVSSGCVPVPGGISSDQIAANSTFLHTFKTDGVYLISTAECASTLTVTVVKEPVNPYKAAGDELLKGYDDNLRQLVINAKAAAKSGEMNVIAGKWIFGVVALVAVFF
jgi:hypothetical protein